MVHQIDGGSVSQVQQQQAPAQTAPDPVVEAKVEETALFAQHYHGDPAYVIEQTMADPSLTQAQKDEYLARVIDLASGSDGNYRTDMGTLDDRARQELIDAVEQIGVAYTGPATPQLREQATASMGRLVDSGRVTRDQLGELLDPAKNPASDGVRELLSTVTDGAVLQNLAYDLHDEAVRAGIDLNSDQGAQGQFSLIAAADLAGMAAKQGFVGAANEVSSYIADHPEVLETIDNLPQNAYGVAPPGRGGFDAVASALAGTSNSADQAKYDQLFGKLVDMAGESTALDRSAGLNSLGDYYSDNIQRLNEETTYAGGWDNSREDAEPPTVYHSLTERFVRNVMLNEDFDNPATQAAIADELTRLGNVVGAQDGAGAPNEAQRTEAAMQFGTLIGSLQGAAADYENSSHASAEEKVETIRTVTDLLTDQVLSKTGPLGEAFGGELVDRLWELYPENARSGAENDVDAALGELNRLGEAIDQAMTQALRDTYPPETADDTGVNGPGIVADYETTVTTHRTNPSE
ncbi:hypothetical protein FHS96_004497 [Sphingomonas zeicaulis]|uniref:hypothetical protein n=1 Tax=Sphingomonas zeicaulis TaxID=1632740 RepID=UPI003D1CE3C7